MSKSLLKIIKVVIAIGITAILIFSLIASQDECHLETCHEEYCIHCAIIHIAQNIINLAISFIIAIIVGVLINFFLSRLRKENKIFKLCSLVFQKVQLNE